jgi:hypothetical protein
MTHTDTVDGAPDRAEDAPSDTNDTILTYIEDQPLTSLIIAFLAGLIVGRLVL